MIDFSTYANGGIARIKPYQAGKPIEEVQRELGIDNIIKLASNENPWGISPKALEVCRKRLAEVSFYPDSNGYYLKQKLCSKFGYHMDMLTLGNGSNELINLVFECLVSDKVNVVIPQYSFIVYPMDATIANAQAKIVPLKNWTVDLDALLAAIDDNTRAVVIANPANPTGTAVGSKALKRFVEQVPERVLVILDEAYNEFQEDPDYEDSAAWVLEHDNLIVSRTFSKAYGLAGLRIGYAVSSVQIASLLNRLRAPFNVNDIAQTAACAVLDDAEHLQKVVTFNNRERQRYAEYCCKRNLYMIPSQANFVSIDFKQDAKPLFDKLLRKGVIVRPLGGYGLNTILRVSIGTPEQNDRFFAALDEVLAGK